MTSTITDVLTSKIPAGNDSHDQKVLELAPPGHNESALPVDKSEEAWENLEDNWENDPDNARNWPKGKKWTAVAIVSPWPSIVWFQVNFLERFQRTLLYRLSPAP